MKGRVDARLLFTSQADAVALATNLDGQIKARSIYLYDTQAVAVKDYRSAAWLVLADARFATRTEAEAVYGWVQSAWNSGQASRRPLPGSTVRFHLCPHDEATPGRCDLGTELVEVVKP